MKLSISPEARGQLFELMAWWDANRSAARVRVEDAFKLAVEDVAAHPMRGKRYPKRPVYRTWYLKGTPYLLFYRFDEDANELRIEAVWGGARGDGPPLP